MPDKSGVKLAATKDPFSMMSGPFSTNSNEPGSQLEVEYAPAYRALKKRATPATRSEFLTTVKPILQSAVRTAGGRSASPLLHGHAKRLALSAVESYDPQKGRLRSHLLSQLRRLHRISLQQQQIIQMPERVIMDRQTLADAESTLAVNLGRDPADQEISDFTGLSLRRLAHIRKAKQPLSQGSMLAADGEFDPAASRVGDDSGEKEWQEFVYADLGSKNKAIMDYMLGMHGTPKKSLTEIAKRLGLSPGAISQRAQRIQAMLDEREELQIL